MTTTMRYVLVTLGLAGCLPEAPQTPSFQLDVMPILAANCVRCHGYPQIGGAPADLRLDAYGDVTSPELSLVGAAARAHLIAERVRSEQMPPRFPLDDYQIVTLERWASLVAEGEDPPRGAPRPDNRSPEVMLQQGATNGSVATLAVSVDDPDGDLVSGEIRVALPGSERTIGVLRSGRFELVVDLAGIPPGPHRLSGIADDGAGVTVVQLGDLVVVGGS